MAYKLPRGKCPYCGRRVALRVNGTVREHQDKETGRKCGGSGQRAS